MGVVAIALELEHAVDEVLEHARARDGAVLRHVADEDCGDVVLLRDAEQPGKPPAPVDRARCRAHVGGVQGLDRVDHADVGRSRSSVAQTASSSVSARIDLLGASEAGGAGSPARSIPRR